MKKGIGIAMVCMMPLLTACQATGGPGTVSSRTLTRINIPDQDKWVGRKTAPTVTVFACRPLACPDPSAVRIAARSAPTRSPDQAALQKFARETVPTEVRAANLRIETASQGYNSVKITNQPRVTTMAGYPAVVLETVSTGSGQPKYGVRGFLFAANTLIDIFSISTTRQTAKANFDAFVERTTVDDQKF